MTELRAPVLIVGSGLAGLTTALMLAWRGVPALLIERHAGTSRNPRARSVNARSMELLRVAGLEEELVAAAGHSFSDFRIVVAESVSGRELRTLLPSGRAGMDTGAISPACPSAAGQDRVEPILGRHAQALGAELRYSTELLSFQQDAEGVDALIVDRRSGREEHVRNVAWRARGGASTAPRAELREALARALCRPPHSLRARSTRAWPDLMLATV